jgi:hypothetical protein
MKQYALKKSSIDFMLYEPRVSVFITVRTKLGDITRYAKKVGLEMNVHKINKMQTRGTKDACCHVR